jgi:hypothetical protein
MDTLPNDLASRNPVSAANRLPDQDALMLAYAANRIATRYNVHRRMARIVAELISTSMGERR